MIDDVNADDINGSAGPTMRAVTQDTFGDTSVLQVRQVPRPTPLPTEVLVRVHAAGVNPVDWKTRTGGGMAGVLGSPPIILGWDVAGVVAEVGYGVTTLRVGDRVYGMPWFPRQAGGYAEYVTAPARQFAVIPDSLSFEHAAAVPLAALTAWQALVDAAHVTAGQRVVITAAAGGVGHFAVQFAKHLGAHVIAVASSRNADWLRTLGADEVVDYTAVRFEEEIQDADVVIELVGQGIDETSSRAVRTARPGGFMVAIPGGLSPEAARAAADAGVRITPILVEPDGHALARIADLIASGAVRVEVAEVYPLEQAALAHARGETHRTRGKLVLAVAAG